jgi:hypothetical protein
LAGVDLFWEKSIAGWLLITGSFWEKSSVSWWSTSQTNVAVTTPEDLLGPTTGCLQLKQSWAYSVGWWLVAGAGLLWEKSTVDWFVVREKYCWLVADKPSEQAHDVF